MRPPDLPGGNNGVPSPRRDCSAGFNETAGFTRRKPGKVKRSMRGKPQRFNEAAGFTQRKLCEAVYDRLFELRFNEAAGFTRGNHESDRWHRGQQGPLQ